MSSPHPFAAVPAAAPVPPALWQAALHGAIACDGGPLAVLAIEGADAQTFLQGQLSNDVAALDAEHWQYTTYNSPKGRMLANGVLWREGEGYRLLLPAELAAGVSQRLAMYVLRSKVTLAELSGSLSRLALGGPAARTLLGSTWPEVPAVHEVRRHGARSLLGLPGERFLHLGPPAAVAAWQEAGSAWLAAPFAVWQWLTVRAGIPIVTLATQDRFVPQAANWDVLEGISFRKGCYTGQEIVARTQYLGRLKERLILAHVDAPVPAAGASLASSAFEGQTAGTVLNAAPAPDGGADLLAVVQLAALAAGLTLDAPGGPPLTVLPLPYAVPDPLGSRGRPSS